MLNKLLLLVLFIIIVACGKSNLQPPAPDISVDLRIRDIQVSILLPDFCIDTNSEDLKTLKLDVEPSSCDKEEGG